MSLIRVGVIGTGALGRHHARLYKECERARLIGVYDTNADAAKQVAAETGVPAFQDMAPLVDQVDALSIAVPTDLHHRVALSLLRQGKHLLIEKPLAQSVDQARQLVRIADERKLVLQVGHVERYNPVLECLEQVPGAPRFIEAHRLAPYPPPRPGLRPRGTEVSVVLDLMIHDIDVILSLVKSEIERVDAVGVPVLSETEDIANARLLFRNRCVANITASRVSAERLRKIRVFKSTAYLSLDYQTHSGELATLSPVGVQRQPIRVDDTNALKAELQDFCTCVAETVRTGEVRKPRVSGHEGLRAVEVADRILAEIGYEKTLALRADLPGAPA